MCKKIFIITLLLFVISVTGCLANSQDNQEIESNVQVQNDDIDTNEPQDVRIINTEPIKYENTRSYEVYWDWHNTTSDILREQLGEEIRVYSYSLSYTGKLEEVGKYYILLDDPSRGLVYIDIDRISAIEKEPEGVTIQPRSSASAQN